MKREIDLHLIDWKNRKKRKPLLLRGARQVGKTYTVRKLSGRFTNLIEVNFEEQLRVHSFFEKSLNPNDIIEKLSIFYGDKIVPGETLLFFDEVQACPNAIRSLRFFCEKKPELHLIAAGSLLEFALEEIPSFGVGRIKNLFMYPLNFSELLEAAGENKLNELIQKSWPDSPIDTVFHDSLLEWLKIFQLIGGMPEVVSSYLKTKDYLQAQYVLDDLITTLTDDFSKYKKRISALNIEEVFKSIVLQSGTKFKYVAVGEAKTETYKKALNLILKAGLAYRVYHTAAQGTPLGAQVNLKKFKIVINDCGIYQRIMGLDLAEYISVDFESMVNKGALTELFVGQELIKSQSPFIKPQLFYWHREAKSSNAEVDYVVSIGPKIIPVEVKSGRSGQMQSLHLFLKERNVEYGIRASHENFDQYGLIKTIPVYSVGKIFR